MPQPASDQGNSAIPGEYGAQPNSQYGMYSEQTPFDNYGSQNTYPRPQMNMRSMPNYGPSGVPQRFVNPQMPQHSGVTSSMSDGMPASGTGPKYQGHGPNDYPMSQFRSEAPMHPPMGYNNQQAQYWNSQMRMGYTPSQSMSAYRNQVHYLLRLC